MSGWATHIKQEAFDDHRRAAHGDIVALIVDKNFPDEMLADQLARGVERFGDAVWVVRETDNRAADALASVGVEPVLAPLVPWWKKSGTVKVALFGHEVGDKVSFDQRKLMRDLAIIDGCTRVVVCRDMSSDTSKWWTQSGHRTDHVRVVEHKAAKRRYKKGRNPNV